MVFHSSYNICKNERLYLLLLLLLSLYFKIFFDNLKTRLRLRLKCKHAPRFHYRKISSTWNILCQILLFPVVFCCCFFFGVGFLLFRRFVFCLFFANYFSLARSLTCNGPLASSTLAPPVENDMKKESAMSQSHYNNLLNKNSSMKLAEKCEMCGWALPSDR